MDQRKRSRQEAQSVERPADIQEDLDSNPNADGNLVVWPDPTHLLYLTGDPKVYVSVTVGTGIGFRLIFHFVILELYFPSLSPPLPDIL